MQGILEQGSCDAREQSANRNAATICSTSAGVFARQHKNQPAGTGASPGRAVGPLPAAERCQRPVLDGEGDEVADGRGEGEEVVGLAVGDRPPICSRSRTPSKEASPRDRQAAVRGPESNRGAGVYARSEGGSGGRRRRVMREPGGEWSPHPP